MNVSLARPHRDEIYRAVRRLVAAVVPSRLPLARMLDELPDEIGPGRPRARDRRPDDLTGRRARRVEPEAASVGDDAVVVRVGEPHREVTRAPLKQLAARRCRMADTRVVAAMDEVGLER